MREPLNQMSDHPGLSTFHAEGPKRRVKAKQRKDRQEATGPNEVWAMDFVHDQLALGKKLRIPK